MPVRDIANYYGQRRQDVGDTVPMRRTAMLTATVAGLAIATAAPAHASEAGCLARFGDIRVKPVALTYTADDFEVSEWIDASHVDIEAHLDPPSLQAVSATKNAYRAALSSAVARGTSRVFTHDVELTLTWYISEKRRYETHIVSDLDNVLKPTIDALVGPDGVLFDDNQVQSIKACWMTGRTPDHRGYQLRVEALMPDDFIPRGGRFVEITPTRCFFVPTMPHKFEVRYVDNLVSTFARYAEWAADGAPDDMLRQLEPTSRSFPRARLSRFEVLKPEQFR